MKVTDKPLKIFVVDDHRDVAEGLADVLRMHGHEVEVAFNGEQAIRAFREKDFDIAFMDVMMPGMNGVESFLEIRKIKPAAKVIMMTGYSVEQLLDQAVEKGAYGVLHKPVAIDDVLEAVERVKSQGVVLVADDDPDFSATIREVLEDRGYRVCLARTGSEAMKTVLGGGVDILVLDLQLPVISGLEVYMQLRKRQRAVPTVVVTGHSREQAEAIDTLRAVSSTGILTKPFASSQLFEEIERLLPPDDAVKANEPETEAAQDPLPEAVAEAAAEPPTEPAPEADEAPAAVSPTEAPPAEAPDEPLAPELNTPAAQTSRAESLLSEWLSAIDRKTEAPAPEPSVAAEPEPAPEPSPEPAPEPAAETGPEPAPETGPEPAPETGPAAARPPGTLKGAVASSWPSDPRPAAEPAAPEQAVEKPAKKPAKEPVGRILAVDDDVDMVEGLAEVLRTRGYEVRTANNVETAKRLIQDFDAQVALLDIRLGKANGLELIPVLKAERPNLYCIMITGNADKESAITALRVGAYDYMTKPLHPSELFAILERCLEKFDLQKRLDQAFEALQTAKNEAEGASRKTSEFLAKLTEELGVPMGEILASAKVFTDEAWGPLGTRQYKDHALSIHDHAAQVLDTLKCSLDLAKAQAGTLEINEDKFDLAALMTWVVRLMKDSIDLETAEIELVLPEAPPMVWGDERHFERILINLLSNAVKFTPEDGRIEIGLETRGDGALAIEVCDSGIGMPPSEIPTALARFGRVDNPGGKKFPGAGLGLPLALAMAELHGGRLTLESEFGQGTVATVIIPAERVDRAAADDTPSGKADGDPGVGVVA